MSHYFSRTLFLPAMLALCLAGAGPAGAEQKIVVGQVVNLSGVNGETARDYIAGAKVYFDYVNSTGGINGMKIDHTYRDDGGDPAKAVVLTREYIEKNKVAAMFGSVGEESIAAVRISRILEQHKVPLVAPLTGVPQQTNESQIFINRPSYAEEMQKVTDYATTLGAKNHVVLYTKNAYGMGALHKLETAIHAAGSNLMAKREIPATGITTKILDNLAAMKPQVVVIIADTITTAEIVKRYRVYDRGVYLVALSMVNHTTLSEIVGPNAAGTIITQVVPSPSKAETPLLREHLKLMKKYRDEPPSHLTLEGFIAAKVLVQALRQAGEKPNPASIRSAMLNLRDIDIQGSVVGISTTSNYGWKFVDVTMLRTNGTLLQ